MEEGASERGWGGGAVYPRGKVCSRNGEGVCQESSRHTYPAPTLLSLPSGAGQLPLNLCFAHSLALDML